jgi:RNA polymerase sigma-70 factor (ECF subfamily)
MTDEELMSGFQKGDDNAFEQLYDRYKRPIYHFIFRRLGHVGRAEELTQEVFLGLLRTRGSWRQEASFKTYIYRIALNQCASEARRTDFKKTEPLERPDGTTVDPPSASDGPDGEVTRREEAELVANALGQLEADQREALLLREYQGLSYEEIAEVMGVALGTVKSRIFRGKLELKRLLEPILSATPGDPGGAKIIPIRSTLR